ncbi:MAG TPA: lipopolysaccharide assembly protein LapA domain-containing protein [Nitrospiria bacterium]|nr:lipopolysaccharide assembly protein LapA domain-containing protein [Nitrospiria bacterium]
MKIKIGIGLAVAGVLLIILLQNNQIVTYRILFWQFSASQLVLLPLTTLTGFLLGLLFGTLRRRSSKT